MESKSGPAPVQASGDALSALGMKRLSAEISLFEPIAPNTPSHNTSDPTLMIICSWAFAQPRHIAKYITPYQHLYPDATILLVQSAVGLALWYPEKWQWPYFRPATTILQQHVSKFSQPRILLHVFSNGGSYVAVQLSQACRELCNGLDLPLDAMVLDSAPGMPRFNDLVDALALGLTPPKSVNIILKGVARAMAYGSASAIVALDVLKIAEPAVKKLYRVLNDSEDVFVWNGKGKRRPVVRTYIYSNTDVMIRAEDVVAHAVIARNVLAEKDMKGENWISLEQFAGTAHVNHVKDDPEKYWSIVRETWERSRVQED